MARSSAYIDRPWCIWRSPGKSSPTGYRYRVEMKSEMRQRSAVSLREALLLVPEGGRL